MFPTNQFVIIFPADVQVGYELCTPLPYIFVDDDTSRTLTETPEVNRKKGPVGLLEAATAPCSAGSSHSVERLSSKSACKQSDINFPNGGYLSRSPWQEEAN